jgi:hypothetical protein
MMSCTTSAAWSHHISSFCYTEYGQHCGAVLSDHISTVAISRSGQLDMHCSVEPNYSGMSTHLADASITHDRALDPCESSCVLRAARPFFIPVVHNPLGVVGYVAAPEPTSAGRRGPELRNTWQHRSPPRQGREVRS